ncbi:hypothetical protein SK128_010954 [Halocaridina rubra]|uniref:Uncharacterized protein n=1 Tax=Halocaridina rubra TaxID=373956 RepID=A0AAN8XCW5_HALRR
MLQNRFFDKIREGGVNNDMNSVFKPLRCPCPEQDVVNKGSNSLSTKEITQILQYLLQENSIFLLEEFKKIVSYNLSIKLQQLEDSIENKTTQIISEAVSLFLPDSKTVVNGIKIKPPTNNTASNNTESPSDKAGDNIANIPLDITWNNNDTKNPLEVDQKDQENNIHNGSLWSTDVSFDANATLAAPENSVNYINKTSPVPAVPVMPPETVVELETFPAAKPTPEPTNSPTEDITVGEDFNITVGEDFNITIGDFNTTLSPNNNNTKEKATMLVPDNSAENSNVSSSEDNSTSTSHNVNATVSYTFGLESSELHAEASSVINTFPAEKVSTSNLTTVQYASLSSEGAKNKTEDMKDDSLGANPTETKKKPYFVNIQGPNSISIQKMFVGSRPYGQKNDVKNSNPVHGRPGPDTELAQATLDKFMGDLTKLPSVKNPKQSKTKDKINARDENNDPRTTRVSNSKLQHKIFPGRNKNPNSNVTSLKPAEGGVRPTGQNLNKKRKPLRRKPQPEQDSSKENGEREKS